MNNYRRKKRNLDPFFTTHKSIPRDLDPNVKGKIVKLLEDDTRQYSHDHEVAETYLLEYKKLP
jgi:hypothetical protein